VDSAAIRRFVEQKLREGLNPATVGHCIRLLSSLFSDLVERALAPSNPIRALPRSTRQLFRPTTDPKTVPFLETLSDVRRVFWALSEPINVAFAIGALAGLRPGEILGLQWSDIDLASRRIHVRQQVQNGRLTGLKDKESRIALVQEALAPILSSCKLRSGGQGLLFKPTRYGGTSEQKPSFMRQHTLRRHLSLALASCSLPFLTWYQATRHTFASQWVLSGGSLEKLASIMGHSSVVVTERYAHLRPDLFREQDYTALDVDLSAPAGEVVRAKSGARSYAGATPVIAGSARTR